MACFPMFMDLQNKKIFLCGSGKDIVDKIYKMMDFHPQMYVFTEKPSDLILNIKGIHVRNRSMTEEDLKECPAFVIASCDEEKNREISEICRKYHIPVNVIDCPKLCDFLFPSLINTDKICIGISSSGVSPTTVVHLRNTIEKILPEHMDAILEEMPKIRKWVNIWCEDKDKKKEVLKIIVQESFLKDRSLTEIELQEIKEKYINI